MMETQQLIEATKHSTDGNTAMTNGNFNSAVLSYKQAAEWYGKAAEHTTDPKSHEALSLLKDTFDFSADMSQQRKLLVTYKQQLTKIKSEREEVKKTPTIPKIDSKVIIK